MYQISVDGFILHDVRLSDEYRLISPVLKQEVNTAGTLSFRIPPTHPYYDKIKKLKSIVTLTQDGNWIFSGRVLNDDMDFYKIKSIEVEGELSFLVDSNQRRAEYHNTGVASYFGTLISNHNAMVEDAKKFTVGSVTVTDPNDSLYRISNYETTLETIQDRLLDRLGGYVRVRHSGDTRYIDYVKDYENINNQQIDFGKNLLDLTKYVEGEDIATAIIPLGATGEDTEERLTIKDVNGGLDYVYDADAVAQYGWIFDTVIFDDVTLAGNLLRKGQQTLAERKLLSIRLELTAVDLHLLDVEIERIKLGDKIKVVSAPHGINEYMMVSALSIDITNAANSTITLGSKTEALTDLTNTDGIAEKVSETITDLGIRQDVSRVRQETRTVSSELSRTSEQITLMVSENYASKSDLEAVNKEFSTQMTVNSNNVEMKFNTVESEVTTINGTIAANQQLLEEYIRFRGALIELGKTGNAFVAKLSNEKLAFLQDNIEIAYISNNKLYITDAEIKNKMTLGNANNGYFDFIPRQNGNLALKWRAK